MIRLFLGTGLVLSGLVAIAFGIAKWTAIITIIVAATR